MTSYSPLTAERIAETNALLAAYAAADDVTVWPTYAAVEQRMNAEELMGRIDESQRIRKSMNQITRQRREARTAARQSKAA